MTIPASACSVRVRYATPAVGKQPSICTLIPAAVKPVCNAADNISPERRVSCPINTRPAGPITWPIAQPS